MRTSNRSEQSSQDNFKHRSFKPDFDSLIEYPIPNTFNDDEIGIRTSRFANASQEPSLFLHVLSKQK